MLLCRTPLLLALATLLAAPAARGGSLTISSPPILDLNDLSFYPPGPRKQDSLYAPYPNVGVLNISVVWARWQDVPKDAINYTHLELIYGKHAKSFFEEVSYGKLRLNITFYRYTIT
ncbi:hypothetical protein T484DRAFT_1827890 [Baffinella frigidus]|nr:hypothetical protein T484DRAFT_1827890 [Cryptophyta sp. CCMP2293]